MEKKLKMKVMKIRQTVTLFWLSIFSLSEAAIHAINSAEQIEEIIESGRLAPGDTIVWADGEYVDEELSLNEVHGTEVAPITLRAATPGGVILRGESRMSLGVKWWVVEGFHFDGSDKKMNSYNSVEFRGRKNIGAEHVRLTNCAMTHLVAEESSSKWVLLYGKNNTVDHCYFTGKRSKGALITVELAYHQNEEKAGHRIAWNHFSDFTFQEGTDNEVIRVGNSEDQHKAAHCVIERNYFDRCDGENEIISNKSSYNTYRGNTFRRCNGALVLRHGHHARVEQNFFLGDGAKDAGGIRVSDSHHVIINNYLQDLTGTTWNAAFSIMGGKKKSGSISSGYQMVDDIIVAHNSMIHCARSFYLNKAKGSRAPTGLIANNLVMSHSDPLVVDDLSANKLKWVGNLFFGAEIGIQIEALTNDPELQKSEGYFRPSASGPASGSAVALEQQIEGDLQGEKRPARGKDIGADQVHGAKGKVLCSLLRPQDVGVTFLNKNEASE